MSVALKALRRISTRAAIKLEGVARDLRREE